jgi:transcriptional antiterminator NusG
MQPTIPFSANFHHRPLDPWFALKVRTRSEHLAATGLRNKGFETFAPTYQEPKPYRGKTKLFDSPLFPGYIFCRFHPADQFVVVNSPGVSQIVTFGNRPAPVVDTEIDAIQRAVVAGAYPVTYLTASQRVRILRGPLAGIEGMFLRSAAGAKVVISVETLQRSIIVSVDADNVISADTRGPATMSAEMS